MPTPQLGLLTHLPHAGSFLEAGHGCSSGLANLPHARHAPLLCSHSPAWAFPIPHSQLKLLLSAAGQEVAGDRSALLDRIREQVIGDVELEWVTHRIHTETPIREDCTLVEHDGRHPIMLCALLA